MVPQVRWDDKTAICLIHILVSHSSSESLSKTPSLALYLQRGIKRSELYVRNQAVIVIRSIIIGGHGFVNIHVIGTERNIGHNGRAVLDFANMDVTKVRSAENGIARWCH